MTITFEIPADVPERIAVAYSPVLEAVLSLHVLAEPKHHPLQHRWVRRMRGLSPATRREIEAFSFAYRAYIPNGLSPGPAGGLTGFHEELARFAAQSPATARFELTRGLDDPRSSRDARRIAQRPSQETIRAAAKRLDKRQADAVHLVLERPAAALQRFATLLADYWDQAFAAEWERLEPELANTVAAAGTLIATRGLYALLGSLWPELRTDPAAGRFWIERQHDHTIQIAADQRLLLIPSYYVWPHVRVNCDRPWPPTVIYPAPQLTSQAHPSLAPQELLRVLRALSDETRLRTLRLIAQQPRSTQELAPLLNITEAAVSKHLRALTDAGLLDRQRQGYWVIYRLQRNALAGIGQSLNEFLDHDRPHG
jgi:DNA-binding transcriptional ArsR family regulator